MHWQSHGSYCVIGWASHYANGVERGDYVGARNALGLEPMEAGYIYSETTPVLGRFIARSRLKDYIRQAKAARKARVKAERAKEAEPSIEIRSEEREPVGV